MVGFADGIMRTLLLHPERLQAQNTMVDVRVHSALTVHSDDSIHADVMDLISVILYMTSQCLKNDLIKKRDSFLSWKLKRRFSLFVAVVAFRSKFVGYCYAGRPSHL